MEDTVEWLPEFVNNTGFIESAHVTFLFNTHGVKGKVSESQLCLRHLHISVLCVQVSAYLTPPAQKWDRSIFVPVQTCDFNELWHTQHAYKITIMPW